MTLCKYRPQRTYGEQYIVDELDTRGLIKALDAVIAQRGEDGLADTAYYVGAKLAFEVLFRTIGDDGAPKSTEYWTDFMREFARRIEEIEYGEE